MSVFELKIPIDVSKVEDRQGEETLRVSAVTHDGTVVSDLVKLTRRGKGTATLKFKEKPKSLKVHVGPGTVAAEELTKLQVLDVQVPQQELRKQVNALTLKPVSILPKLWRHFFRLCRKFTVEGTVTCPDGLPVPGAEVTAFDIDRCWWWSSKQSVGSAITDEHGHYEIEFDWCCGYWPWWWWHNRHWRLDSVLVSEIDPILQLAPDVLNPPDPTPTPSLKVFERLLESAPDAKGLNLGNVGELLDVAGRKLPGRILDQRSANLLSRRTVNRRIKLGGSLSPVARTFDPSALARLRKPLLRRLPAVEQLSKLRVWPWFPWYGWRDCNPDLIFRITQPCGDDPVRVLVDEDLTATRWNVPTHSVVNFTAEDGCCIDDSQTPPGECLHLTHVCDVPTFRIGGNPTAPIPAPEGYVDPGTGDQPFAGTLNVSGEFGFDAHADSDYYEIEWFDDGVLPAGEWKALPPGSFVGFNRSFYGRDFSGANLGIHRVAFPVQEIGGRRVIETRHHFEGDHGAGSWHNVAHPDSRWWSQNKNLLGRWRTDGFFADGLYRLRVKSWTFSAPDTLKDPQILDVCGSGDDGEDQGHEIVVRIDNQVITSVSAHGEPCGAGTVHTCTREPETQILEVEILDANGDKKGDLEPCSDITIADDDKLRIQFRAHDVDGHLSSYRLQITYGENQKRVLIGGAIAPASHGPVVDGTPTGPTYADALGDGADSPEWYGGDYFLEVERAGDVFPVTCCYQLELRAEKRTIVNCSNTKAHHNVSERSFMVRRA